jgi:hypothetical protein
MKADIPLQRTRVAGPLLGGWRRLTLRATQNYILVQLENEANGWQ